MDDILNPVNAGQEQVVAAGSAKQDGAPNTAAKTDNAEDAQIRQKKSAQPQEENAKYAAARRRAEAEVGKKIAEAEARARDGVIAELGWEINGKRISGYDEFLKARTEAGESRRDIGPFVKKDEAGKREADDPEGENGLIEDEKERVRTDHEGFFDFFRRENGREFSVFTDSQLYESIRAEAKKNGSSLKDAYSLLRNAELKEKVAKLESKLRAWETNARNADSSPGSISDGCSASGGTISYETFEANRHNQSWVKKNFKKILESRAKW